MLFITFFITILTCVKGQNVSVNEKNYSGNIFKSFTPRSTVEVTFQVNMANETVSDDGVHLAGSWQGDPWDPEAITMTAIGDDIYSATVTLESGTQYFYAFYNGSSVETVPDECQSGFNEPPYRHITPGSSNTTIDPVCFNYCINCAPFYDVTLEVNMQYETVSSDSVYVEGTFAYYTGQLMTSSDGVLWTTTVSLMEGSIPKYRFYNGKPQSGGVAESWSVPFPPCVGFEPLRRYFEVPAYDTTMQVCFEYCSTCPDLIISEIASPADDPSSGFFIELYNAGSETIDFSDLPIWLLQYSEFFQWSERLIGSLDAGEKFVVGSSDFEGVYDFTPDLESYEIYGNGNDAFFLYMGNESYWLTQIDAFGSVDELGVATTVDYVDTKAVRLRSVTTPSPEYLPQQWHLPVTAAVEDMTPGAHCEDVNWTGSGGTNWNAKGNFDGSTGYIPDASYNLAISATGNNPSISAEAAINNLNLAPGANLTLEADKWLTVYGNLDISSGNLIIQSDGSGQGSLITYGTVSGQADIEKKISDGTWHLVSSPVDDATAIVFYGEYLQTYDEPTDSWVEVESENELLNPMQGYALWGVAPLRNTTYIFNGTPNTGNTSFGFSYTSTGWNMIGNPYPSGIDWDSVATDLPAGLNDAIYYLDATTGNYVSYIAGLGNGSPFIPAMQGFWVNAYANGTLSFNNEERTHQGSGLYYKNEEILNNYIELLAARNSEFDQAFIRFRDVATAEFDGKYDAYKLMAMNKNFPQLFTYAGNDILSINQLPEVEVMDLGFYCGASGTYTILLAEMNGIAKCLLEDMTTGQTQDLKMGSYSFAYTAGEPEKRFKLHFDANSVYQAKADENIHIYSKRKNVIVSSKNVIQNSQLQITDLSGRILLETDIDNQQSFSLNTGLSSGIYLVVLKGQGSIKTEKVMIE